MRQGAGGAARAARVRAQAKLNLFLRILARERSGYHQIETLFARIDLADDVVVRAGTRGRSLDVAGPELPTSGIGPAERNLAWRAALAYAEATGWPEGFAIEITKRIPVGGGLGGGSADAGAVLRALNALAPRPAGERELARIAAPLGADVPFMALSRPLALAWGRGDRLLPLDGLPARPVALLVPSFAISTADAYGWVAASRSESHAAGASLLEPARLRDWRSLAELAANDFEPEVVRRHPEIRALMEALARHGAPIARMSGSGSTVFGIVSDAAPPDVWDALAADAAAHGARLLRTRTAAHVEEVGVGE
ncbi:MAG TPA: 4-(cytidine 5'-diphospho)-2-C-methyl-D-erythritol kinase [Gemmatimonadaceae bacterium]|nr:4-(cytidine 5'-diphospho)-2-C-methyl-D-erythritol kinase [Gemmatimonadaceae bacterium]